MTISQSGYKTRHDPTLSQTPSDGEAGDGGPTLNVWTQDRVSKLDALAGGTFTNESSFPIPAGIVDPSTNPYDVRWTDSETKMGNHVSGLVLTADGKPMSGSARIYAGDQDLVSKTLSGDFILSGGPLPGVEIGADVDRKAVGFEFDPSITAVSLTRESIGGATDIGVVQYGAISGTVTDYDGNPVEGETIVAGGVGTTTDSNGDYSLSAPGGTSLDVTGLGVSKSKTPAAGATIDVNFQLSRIEVEVLTPGDLEPVVGAEVLIGDQVYETGEDGRAVLQDAHIVEYEILVFDSILLTADVINEGSLVQKRVGTAAQDKGVDLTLKAAGSGARIDRLGGRFPEAGTQAVTTQDGRLRLFTDNDNDTTLVLAEGDSRYETVEVDLDLQDGQDVSANVELEPKTLVSNA